MLFKNRRPGHVYIIAEVGINHNGDIEEAKALIKAAFEAGADAAKIQVRNLQEVYTEEVLRDPLKAEQGTQYLLNELKKAQLSESDVRELAQYARQFNGDFFATPFDIKSAKFLNDLGMQLFKIGSPDFTNLPLIKTIIGFGKPLILSTGMSDEPEIEKVISILKTAGADFSLLHCNSTYPASDEDLNLRYIPKLREVSGVPVGYSGHEQGYGPTLAAVALGAEIVERHITKDRAQSGPDHRSSLSFEQFRDMVQEIRKIEVALGKAQRNSSQGEMSNRLSLAKSLVAAEDLPAGTILTEKHIAAKTPAKGVSPLEMDLFVGQTLATDLKKDQYLFTENLQKHEPEAGSDFKINRHWGIVGRLNDFRDFIALKPKLIEIHMTWRDLVSYQRPVETFSQDLVVHAPEYYQDRLIDFTSEDQKVTEYSIEMLRRTIEVARDLNQSFKGQTNPKGPRVVVHPGGHFAKRSNSNKSEQYRLLMKRLQNIDSSGVQLLVENMPPFPWYFGGQWFNTIFMDSKEIAQFANEMGWGFCYDTSHALLYCNYAGTTLREFTKNVLDHTAYLHISDGKGSNQEGLQLGKGDLQHEDLLELLGKINVGFIPEIWQGHLNGGQGFKEALHYIENLLEKSSGRSCSDHCTDPTHNH
jgi:N-acetylneuraminate synthase